MSTGMTSKSYPTTQKTKDDGEGHDNTSLYLYTACRSPALGKISEFDEHKKCIITVVLVQVNVSASGDTEMKCVHCCCQLDCCHGVARPTQMRASTL